MQQHRTAAFSVKYWVVSAAEVVAIATVAMVIMTTKCKSCTTESDNKQAEPCAVDNSTNTLLHRTLTTNSAPNVTKLHTYNTLSPVHNRPAKVCPIFWFEIVLKFLKILVSISLVSGFWFWFIFLVLLLLLLLVFLITCITSWHLHLLTRHNLRLDFVNIVTVTIVNSILSQKNEPIRLMRRNFTSSQYSVNIFFVNRPEAADIWADFEQLEGQ